MRYFNRPGESSNRRVNLVVDSSCDPAPVVIGSIVGGGNDTILRHDCASPAEALTTYRHIAKTWTDDGFAEIVPINYWQWTLPPEPEFKPDWQRALDELALDVMVARGTPGAEAIASLAATPAAAEPLYLWLAGLERLENAGDAAGALKLAGQARDEYARRRLANAPFYGWSIWWPEIEAAIYDLMGTIYYAVEDMKPAIAAFERANKVAASSSRGGFWAELVCEHCPKRREEAFDQTYRYARFGGYERIEAMPEYVAYAERRKKAKGGKGWRWGPKRLPTSVTELRAAGEQIGAALPKDYEKFLRGGRTEILVRIDDASAEVRFFRAAELGRARDNHIAFLNRTGEDAEGYVLKEYGVSLRHLVPIAEVANQSRDILIHLGEGDRYGWCFRWYHDDSFVLEAALPSFEEMLKAMTSGVEARNSAVLGFLGVSVD